VALLGRRDKAEDPIEEPNDDRATGSTHYLASKLGEAEDSGLVESKQDIEGRTGEGKHGEPDGEPTGSLSHDNSPLHRGFFTAIAITKKDTLQRMSIGCHSSRDRWIGTSGLKRTAMNPKSQARPILPHPYITNAVYPAAPQTTNRRRV